MRWYRAVICTNESKNGDCHASCEKAIHYFFKAMNYKRALRKADRFIRKPGALKKLWGRDPIGVTYCVGLSLNGSHPKKECAILEE